MCASVEELGRHVLYGAHLPPAVRATCEATLSRRGHLFSASPMPARVFLAWAEALVGPDVDAFRPAAVACECMVAGYDVIDTLYDRCDDPAHGDGLTHRLPAGVALLLLAQELLARLDLPAERKMRACTAFTRAGRRACAGHLRDWELRWLPPATPATLFSVLRQRSGSLIAACCQCAALLAGAHWRVVAFAGRFGQAFGCALQLQDDLIDFEEDAALGRQTIPTLLALDHSGFSAEVVEATTLVLIQRALREAAGALTSAHIPLERGESLWSLLPPIVYEH